MNDELTSAINYVKKRLVDFTSSNPKAPDLIWQRPSKCISVDRYQFPVPSLVLFLLHDICGFPLGWRGDKTHWVIPFRYKGIECAISHEKFGIRLYLDETPKKRVYEVEILGKLKRAIEAAERNILTKIAQTQIQSANITIINQFIRLSGAYDYFRNRVDECFKTLRNDKEQKDIDGLVEVLNRSFQAKAEGAYNAIAMIDAYFSRLEHFLVLALPFASFDRKLDNLSVFIGSIWSAKMKRVLPWVDPKTQAFYSKLISVKEKYRNTFAHGGFEKKGSSFYFHLPKIGAIPASMSGFRNSVHFSLFPLEESHYIEVCSLFDEFDGWLQDEALPTAWRFAGSGLDMRFDQKYLDELLEVSADLKAFEEWIKGEINYVNMLSNADY